MAHEKSFRFKSALVGDQWLDDAVIAVSDGVITSIKRAGTIASKNCHAIAGVALPGIPNVHSHAFQRGFAGLSEFRTAENEDRKSVV